MILNSSWQSEDGRAGQKGGAAEHDSVARNCIETAGAR